MDFFLRNFEAAQEHARSITASAGQSAKGFAEQLTEHTRTLAEQAASVSTVAAEQASQHWKGLNLPESLQLRTLQSTSSAEAGPSREELERFAITSDFKEFIRSLTYSTFRDFPLDQVQETQKGIGSNVLTPWQEKHALLVVQEVKEINELRFVLCPKRMNDAQFWLVYFTLAKKYLPSEAWNSQLAVSESKEPSLRTLDLHSGLTRTLENAREAAREWSCRASGSLRPAETSAQLHDLVESRSRETTPKAPAKGGEGSRPFTAEPSSRPSSREQAEPDLDNDLEAYLQTITNNAGDEHGAGQNGADGESTEAEDLDQYLHELTTADDAGNAGEDSGDEAVDLEEYMLQLEDEHGSHNGAKTAG